MALLFLGGLLFDCGSGLWPRLLFDRGRKLLGAAVELLDAGKK